tara:strand:- start:193 stop:420 length:228 start_codon:yes stop_codon:yes gene_type:complete
MVSPYLKTKGRQFDSASGHKMIKKIKRKLKGFFFSKPYGTQNANNRNSWLKKVVSEIPSGLTILDAGAGNGNKKI